MSPFESWSESWFGWWREDDYDPFRDPSPPVLHYRWAPSIFDFVDAAWAPPEKDRILHYLTHNSVAGITFSRNRCIFGGFPCIEHQQALRREQLMDFTLTDGEFVWRRELAHYVEHHSVRLPDRMVDHMTAAEYRETSSAEYNASTDERILPPGFAVCARQVIGHSKVSVEDLMVGYLERRGWNTLANLVDGFGRHPLKRKDIARMAIAEARKRGHPGSKRVYIRSIGTSYFAYVYDSPGWTSCEVFISRETGVVERVNGPWKVPTTLDESRV